MRGPTHHDTVLRARRQLGLGLVFAFGVRTVNNYFPDFDRSALYEYH